MHILLTRPLDDSKELILRFKSLGHRVSHLPLISVNAIEYIEPNYTEFGGIIFTSANAIKFLDIKSIDKKIICFCVGDSTEKKARSIGFQNVITAEGNVRYFMNESDEKKSFLRLSKNIGEQLKINSKGSYKR